MADRIVAKAVPTAGAVQCALAKAVETASGMGCAINVAIADSGGNLAGFLRMPDAFLASIGLAIDKAKTAAGFGMSTEHLGHLLDGETVHVRDGVFRHPGVTSIPGGVPVRIDGQLAGGIGVSGGSARQDQEIAQAAVAALMEY